jgi:serine/threonine protein kinase
MEPQNFPAPQIPACTFGTAQFEHHQTTFDLLTIDNVLIEVSNILVKTTMFGRMVSGCVVELVPGTTFYRRTNVLVTVKIYNGETLQAQNFLLNNGEFENPFNEISISQQLGDHPGICSMLGFGRDPNSNSVYIVTPRFDDDCYQLIEESGGLNEDLAKDFLRQILGGLEHLHTFGIAHRDVSLENILYKNLPGGQRQYCLVADSCLLMPINAETGGGFSLITRTRRIASGRRTVMDPTVLTGLEDLIDPRKCDLWSLGVVLYMTIAGARLYERPSMEDRAYEMIAAGQLRAWVRTWFNPQQISDQCLDLIFNMLQPSHETRYTINDIRNHAWLLPTIAANNDFIQQ